MSRRSRPPGRMSRSSSILPATASPATSAAASTSPATNRPSSAPSPSSRSIWGRGSRSSRCPLPRLPFPSPLWGARGRTESASDRGLLRLRRLHLQRAQLGDGDVAADEMPVLRLDQRRLLAFADAAGELARAARVEDTAAGRMDRAGDLARKPDTLATLAIDGGNGGKQRLCIGMMRAGEDPLRRADLHQPAEI